MVAFNSDHPGNFIPLRGEADNCSHLLAANFVAKALENLIGSEAVEQVDQKWDTVEHINLVRIFEIGLYMKDPTRKEEEHLRECSSCHTIYVRYMGSNNY